MAGYQGRTEDRIMKASEPQVLRTHITALCHCDTVTRSDRDTDSLDRMVTKCSNSVTEQRLQLKSMYSKLQK